jgi:hypothetical protein
MTAAAELALQALAAPQPLTLVDAVITCGVPLNNAQAFADATGVFTVAELYCFRVDTGHEEIIDAYHGRLATNAVGRALRVTAIVTPRLEALIWLVHDKTKRNQQVLTTDWSPATVRSVIERMRVAEVAKEQAFRSSQIWPTPKRRRKKLKENW